MKRILIVTQVVDTNHPILGFFHRWIEEFARHCESVEVIALQVGVHSLPANVRVHSLGKEAGENRLKYIWRFYKYCWCLRHEYDTVFVHMNQVYITLAGLWWWLQGKRISLWYAHGTATLSLKVAVVLTKRVFSISTTSFPLVTKKLMVTGHGIDTTAFVPSNLEKTIDCITVGRVSEAKNLHTLIEYFSEIVKIHPATLTIVGPYVHPTDAAYYQRLCQLCKELGVERRVFFVGAKTNTELPLLLQQSRVFVHTAQNGSIDKAVLEALAAGVPVVTTATVNASLPVLFVESQAAFVVQTLEVLQSTAKQSEIDSARKFVKDHHSLQSLIPKIITSL